MTKQLEHHEQAALIHWTRYMTNEYPELDLLFAIPNGGQRSAITGARLKAEGVKPGVPDLFLPVARGGYHGLFIEMKAGRNGTTGEQDRWIAELAKQMYFVKVCYSTEEAILTIEDYLMMEKE